MCKYSLLQIISPYSFFILLLKVTPCARALYDYEPQETGYVQEKNQWIFLLNFYMYPQVIGQYHFLVSCVTFYFNCSDLTLHKGEIITLLKQVDENWFEGFTNGCQGFLPANYVEVIINRSTFKHDNFANCLCLHLKSCHLFKRGTGWIFFVECSIYLILCQCLPGHQSITKPGWFLWQTHCQSAIWLWRWTRTRFTLI